MTKKKTLKGEGTQNGLTEAELECKDTIHAFLTGGAYANERLKVVLSNIWKHYEVCDEKRQKKIMALAKRNHDHSSYDEPFTCTLDTEHMI